MIGVLAAPPPPLSVQRLTPTGSGGEAFPPNRTVDFPQGNFTVLPLIRSPVFPASHQRIVCFFSFFLPFLAL